MKKVVFTLGFAVAVCWIMVMPDAVEAQSGSVLLDANLSAGYQGATGVETVKAGQRVSVEVFGRDVAGISGFSAQIAFDASKLSFDGVSDGGLIPGFTGLKIVSGSGAVEIGGASVDGVSKTQHGRLGVVHFIALTGFSGSANVSIQKATLSTGATSQSSSVTSQVVMGLTPATAVVLDADLTAGYQAGRSVLDFKAGDQIALEVYGTGLVGASGYSATLQYDASKLSFKSFSDGGLIPGFTGLKVQSSGSVEIGGASVDGVARVNSGRLGVVTFEVLAGVSGSFTIKMINGRLVLGGTASDFQSDLVISIGSVSSGGTTGKVGDFDGNGKVEFSDFLSFAQGFGKKKGDAGFNAVLDVDKSGAIDFPDFLLFAQNFGK